MCFSIFCDFFAGVVSGAMLLIEDDPRIDPDTVWQELIVSATVRHTVVSPANYFAYSFISCVYASRNFEIVRIVGNVVACYM